MYLARNVANSQGFANAQAFFICNIIDEKEDKILSSYFRKIYFYRL